MASAAKAKSTKVDPEELPVKRMRIEQGLADKAEVWQKKNKALAPTMEFAYAYMVEEFIAKYELFRGPLIGEKAEQPA